MKKKKEKWIEKLDYRSQCVLTFAATNTILLLLNMHIE